MHTLLHMDANVGQLLQDDGFHKRAAAIRWCGSLKSADGCMADTRVNVLEDLERWADDDTAPKVCWLGGMAGIGKSSVAVTFSERMDKKLKLRASFFCSDSGRDARLIVPTIAFRDANRQSVERHKIVVIHAIDECVNQLNRTPNTGDTFLSSPNVKVLHLHGIPKDHVQADIRRYLKNSLSKLAINESDWPPDGYLSILLERPDKLFIYAATAMRYMIDHRFDFKQRLQQVNALGSTRPTPSQTGPLDQLYNHVMSRAFPPSAEKWKCREDMIYCRQ
ncbi:hypothetical protein JB92DRAFT_3093087 [Gautieria morchelliformis]|nr:hypothetical protein JB92DRAFT_3093087 [Gautieria morchelliformis]